MTSNEQFLDAMLRHQIGLLRLVGSIRNDVFSILDATEADLADRIRSRLLSHKGFDSPASVRRLEALEKWIRLQRGAAWDSSLELWESELKELAVAQPKFVANAIQTVSPTTLVFAFPSPALLRTLALENPFHGRILKEWAASAARSDIDRILSQVRIGMVQGESSKEIARRVVGTKLARGADGVTAISRREAAAITRTAVNHVANRVNREFLNENSNLFEGEQYVATLDSRTTPICRSLDGEQFPVGEGPIPPMHFNCRSTRVPVIDGEVAGQRPAKPTTERMLVREYAEQNGLGTVSRRSGLPRGHKGAFDAFARVRTRELVGQVPAKLSYNEWLGRQSVPFQREVLGPTRYKLWKQGGVPLDKFVNRAGDEIPLSELSRLQTEAFTNAGLDPARF